MDTRNELYWYLFRRSSHKICKSWQKQKEESLLKIFEAFDKGEDSYLTALEQVRV
jgi:Ca2+-binding EF-hand superfamily protein